MALISRHPGAPYVAGETLNAEDLEQDIAAAHGEINGNLSDVNFSAGAAIDGSKLASGTIGTLQLADSSVTSAKIAADAVTGAKIGALTVTQDNLAANAASIIAQDTAATSFVLSASYQTIATVNLTTAVDAGPILLFFSFRRSTGSTTDLYRIRRDSTDLVADVTSLPVGSGLSGSTVETHRFLIDTAATDATAHVYTMALKQASGSTTATHIHSFALELRR